MAKVVEQARLVLHVAEHDDRVGMPRLEDGRQRDPLVDATVRVAQDDVVAAGHRLDGERFDDGGEERVAEVADDRPDQHGRRPAQASGVRVRSVAELTRGDHHPFAGVGRDRHAGRGVVEHTRDGALGHACHPGDVAHGGDMRRGPLLRRPLRFARRVDAPRSLRSHPCKRSTRDARIRCQKAAGTDSARAV